MKTNIIHATTMILCCFVSIAAAAEPVVTEIRQADGKSLLTVTDGQELTVYTVDTVTKHSPATDPNDPRISRIKSWKWGAFLCYNTQQHEGTEYGLALDPSVFNPSDLDIRQWMQTLKDAKMKYAVLTVRHTSPFLLWDSRTSEIDVMKSPVGKDLFKEFVEECRAADIIPAVYYCMWGGPNFNGPAQYRNNQAARATILAQIHELATLYGHIPYFWIDMPQRTGWMPANLSEQELYNAIRNDSPESIVVFNGGIDDASRVNAFPTDLLNGEMRLPVAGYQERRVVGGNSHYLPHEYEPCLQKRGDGMVGQADYKGACWFTYGEGKSFTASQPYSAAFLNGFIQEAYARGSSNTLLACAPDHTGKFRPQDAKALQELGKLITQADENLAKGATVLASSTWDGNYGAALLCDNRPHTRWAAGKNTTTAWVEINLPQAASVMRASILEIYDRIQGFTFQAKVDGNWITLAEGTTIGERKELTFPPITAANFRLNITQASNVPSLLELQLFEKLDPLLDQDGDGQSNGAEDTAGTNPFSQSSFLKIISVSITGNDAAIAVATVPGKTYQLETSSTLISLSWQNVGSPVTASGATTAFTASGGAVSPNRFYRVKVVPGDP